MSPGAWDYEARLAKAMKLKIISVTLGGYTGVTFSFENRTIYLLRSGRTHLQMAILPISQGLTDSVIASVIRNLRVQ